MVSFLTDTVVCGFSLYHILAYFLIYSCIGWCLEVIYAAATTGQLVNRGFLNGPVCPIYGFGMIIVLFALTPLQHSILLLYIGGVILPSALELVGGWALYKIYHTRWWDYSDFPFNIGGYICLEFCLLWGVGTLVVMRIVHPVVADLVDLIPPFVGVILMCFLYAVYAADVVATAIAASALADTPERCRSCQRRPPCCQGHCRARRRAAAIGTAGRRAAAAQRGNAGAAAAHPPHRGPAPYAACLPEAPARQQAAQSAHIAGDAAPRRTGKQGRQQEYQMTPNAAPAPPCVAFLLHFARIMLLKSVKKLFQNDLNRVILIIKYTNRPQSAYPY